MGPQYYTPREMVSGQNQFSSTLKDFNGFQTQRSANAALLALQEKNKFLQEDNSRLVEIIGQFESGFYNEKTAWEQGTLQKAKENQESEAELQDTITQLQKKLAIYQAEKSDMVEAMEKMKKQVSNLEAELTEKSRDFEKHNERFLLQFQAIQGEVTHYKDTETYLSSQVNTLENEKSTMNNKTSQLEEKLMKLQRDYDELQRRTSKDEKDYAKATSDRERFYKQKYIKNKLLVKSLKELINQQEKQISTRRSQDYSQRLNNRPMTERRHRPKQSVTIGPAILVEDQTSSSQKIAAVEAEIRNINQTYRNVLAESKQQGADLKSIKQKLVNLAQEIQDKNDILIALKKQQRKQMKQASQ